MKLLILNGPNLNLLGKREPTIYGNKSFEDYFEQLTTKYPNVDMIYKQSNHEGTLVDIIHEYGFEYDGIVLNAGAYTHTSVAIADAIAGVETGVIEVHISNVHAREVFRHKSYMAKNCVGTIAGLGLKGYELAVQFFLEQ
ncbi:type II 3-dehydroquinate dehydratase [Flammeovirga pectinis]|uniref:3-dehydroquinate dehydratase n=1 Tax=Flammeovirga pectinis TaxID=2494373 RepID=A0A3Q9FR36_9BACT|nr:type II 3-dehydroquinate dehydratase [Flammeovirga pectinis]AZQ62594.1 type II 3-dehydroquinate dehydratase [Flammeovirga pectinis]